MPKRDAAMPASESLHSRRVDAVRSRLKILQSTPEASADLRSGLLAAQEELRVAQEELEAQNRTLIESFDQTDQERRSYKELFDQAPAAYLLSDIHGIVRQGNHYAASLLGVHQRFLTGKSMAGFVVSEDRAGFRATLSELGRTSGPLHVLARLQPRSGAVIAVAMSASTIRAPDGRAVGLRWLVSDASEEAQVLDDLRRSEREARHAAEASDAQSLHVQKLESIGVLAGGLAHDFNNLLHVILNNTDLALVSLAPDAEARAPIHEVIRATKQAADLTKQMLAYSGRWPVEIRMLDLSREVRAMGSLFQSVISKHAALAYDLASNLPPVRADGTQVRQIVMNLLTNASEALGDTTGSITLRTARSDESDDEVVLEVSDTGPGMDYDTAQRIFDPFFSTKYSGRGLGLAAVNGIVKTHGGRIRVRTAPGRGTTFRVFLPAAAGVADPPRVGKPRSDWHGGGTVLVAEDEEAARVIAQRMLTTLGFDTLAAADGREAVGIMDREGAHITAVLLDLSMPRIGGREALRLIRARWPEMAVILMSGYTTQSMIPAGDEEPDARTAYLQKPFLKDDLAGLLRELVDPLSIPHVSSP